MKRLVTTLMLMVLFAPFAMRADEITIGTAMDASYTHPFALDYKNSWTEAIYFEEEIGMAGLITEISFYCTNPQSRACQDLRIYMGVSDKIKQSSTSGWLPESELTLVYQGPSDLVLGAQEGWQTFILDEPFIYEGYDNLIVAVGRASDNYTYSQKWAYTWTDNAVLYRQNDYNSAYGYHPGNGSGYQSSKRANIKLGINSMDGFCGRVKSINIDEYNSNSATVSIVPRYDQVAWDYFIATTDVTPDEFTVPTAANVADTTYTFTGLAGATEYNVWVRANCGESLSSWKSKKMVTFPEWEGTGTENDPIIISSIEDIITLNLLLSNNVFDTDSVFFLQTSDIDNLDFTICPSGTSFKGIWDGNGHTTNLNISGNGYQGMFSSLSAGAVVRNVTTTGIVVSTNLYNGGITGCMYNDAIIENCVNYATIQSNSGCTAGIAGYVQSNSLVEGCVNYGDILDYGNWHGGIAGYMNNTGYVKNCTNYGTIQGYQYLGGISSECVNNSVIIDCANLGDVDAAGAYVGGITGHINKGYIYNSYNVGEVKGSQNIGGITGYFQSNDTICGIIENVYNGGNIVSTNGVDAGSLIGNSTSGTMRHAYYLEGTHELAYGNSCNTERLFDSISFMASDIEKEFVLSEEHFGTTDLLTALNAYEGYGENEWKKDIYGNNKNMPTFNIGEQHEEPEEGVNIDVVIGADGTTGSANVPMYEYYNYSISQQIYTADEMLGVTGTITSIAFKQFDNNVRTRNLAVYLLNTDKELFSSYTDWASVPAENLVFSDTVTYPGVAGEWMELDLQTPFEYTGGNLLVCVLDNTGSYVSAANFYTYDADTAMRALYAHRDGSTFDVTNPAVSGYFSMNPTTATARLNTVKFELASETTTPEPETTVVLSDNFNDGELSGWRVIDVDGDGHNWMISNSGIDNSSCIISTSYLGGFLNPDNYIVTTSQYTLSESSEFTFLAHPKNSNYKWDNYGVVISEDNENWTVVWNEMFDDDSPTSFTQKTIDLSEYAGKEVYIGFRHYENDPDWSDGVLIDDVVLTGIGSTPEEPDETIFSPVKYITATEVDNEVQVVWSMYGVAGEDFETGDFSANEWNNEVSDYPWVIVEGGNESDHAMKSTCEGVASGVSAIEITVDVPYDGAMGFDYRVSSESGWDFGYFYIDGVMMASASGETDWYYEEVNVTEGTHTYRWEYLKDGSYENGEDAFFIDNIVFYTEPEPFTGGWITYDDGTYATCIGTGSQSPVYWGASFPAAYAGYSVTKVSVYDSGDSGVAGSANATANIYLGGTTAPGTLVATQNFTLTGANDYVEVTLDAPVALDGTQTLWVIFYCDELGYPAAGCNHVGDHNSDWLSLDGIEWNHSPDLSVSYTWMVAANLENAKGQTAMLTTASKAPKFEGGASTGTFVANENATPRYVGSVAGETASMNKGTRAFSSYNLYKRNVLTGDVETLVTGFNDTVYTDYAWATDETGVYQWGVSAVYEGNRGMQTYFAEGFEGGEIPTDWTIDGSQPWTVRPQWNNYYGNTVTPAEGSYFVLSAGVSYSGPEYKLISPLTTIKPKSTMTLQYSNAAWESDVCQFEVSFAESASGPWTAVWSTGNTSTTFNEWKDATIDLSEIAGKTGYLAFINRDFYGHYAAVDNIVIANESPESEIKWSKPIDKDMLTTVTVSAITDNGDPVDGTMVSFVNLIEEGINFEATLNEEGFVTFDNFRKGTYEFTVYKEGYYSNIENEVIEITDASEFTAFLTEILASVEGLYVSPTGWAMWDGEDLSNRAVLSYTVMLDGVVEAEGLTVPYYQHENLVNGMEYTTTVIANYTMGVSEEMSYSWTKVSEDNFPPVTDLAAIIEDGTTTLTWTLPVYEDTNPIVYEFSSNFDNGSLTGWTNIDANNDGYIWMNTSEYAYQGFGVNDTYCAVSWSYDMANDQAIMPDNYLITDKKYTITESSILTYSISAHDRTFDKEHYGVAISTTGTTPEDFTVIFEETLSAGEAEYEGSLQGQWYDMEIDLSAYAGQQIYIAFRHFNCHNMTWLKLDNVELTNSSKRNEDGAWLAYHNGINKSAIGLTQEIGGPGLPINWAIMFPADVISEYAGTTITKVSLYVYEGHQGEFSIHFGGDNAPGTAVHTQSYDFSNYQDQTVEIELTNPVQISGTENVWVQFSNSTGTHVASYAADCGDPNARWMSDNGGATWYDTSYFGEGWYGAWQISAYVEEKTTSTPDEPGALAEILGVMIYRNGELLNSTPITDEYYTDTEGQDGDEYCVKVVYGGDWDYTYYAMSEAVCTEAVSYIFTQATDLSAGWNWYSSYIDAEGAEGLNLMKDALGTSAIQIKSQTAFINYEYIWSGSLQETNLEEMYMIKMNEPITMDITGYIADPAENPISLGTNWKWIGYPVNGYMSVDEAFANVNPANGDYVKSQDGFAQYYDDLGWTGTLNTMEPGQGYMYQNTSGSLKTLLYPNIVNKETRPNITPENNHWSVDTKKYAHNMTVIAVAENKDLELSEYEIAAFANGECRGSARPIFVEQLDSYMLFLTVYGDDCEKISFRYYDLNSREEVELIDVMNYSVNATVGDVMNPYVFNLSTLGMDELSGSFKVYPNPVDKDNEIFLGATYETVEIYNTLGVKVYEYTNVDSIDGIETSGVYVIKATNNGNVSYSRIVVK